MPPETLATLAADTSPPAAEDIGPRIYGVIDVLRADRVAGWAIDRSDAAAALDIDILRDGRVIRTVRADRHRARTCRGRGHPAPTASGPRSSRRSRRASSSRSASSPGRQTGRERSCAGPGPPPRPRTRPPG